MIRLTIRVLIRDQTDADLESLSHDLSDLIVECVPEAEVAYLIEALP